jgi:TetR/AcrR family transcriptional regulator
MNTGQSRKSERKQKERAGRRREILAAAREVFFMKGFMDATVDDIAGKCGLAKGTIYLYFKSKEELYVSIMAEGMGRLRKEFEALTKHPPGEKGLVENAFRAYYGFYLKNRKYFRIMFLSSQPDLRARVPAEVLRKCADTGHECLGIVRDLVQEGIEHGYYRRVDPWAVANILWATVNGIIMAYEQDPIYRDEIATMELEQLLHHSLDLALEGLRAGK